MGVLDFFSPEAGQKRTAWRNDKLRAADGLLDYYLGPTGVPDKLEALGGLLNYTDAGDMPAAAEASRTFWNSPSTGNAAELAAASAAMAIPFVGARMMDDGVDFVSDAIRSGKDDVGRFAAGEAGEVGRNLSPSQAKAQEVLDLIAQGRASEVTDDMLAAADDAYLYRNYDLPMDEASRMARAKEMGHRIGMPLYHGTNATFQHFRPPHRRNPYETGVSAWAARDPQVAGEFADSAQTSPQMIPLVHRAYRPVPADLPDGVTNVEVAGTLNDAFSSGYDGVLFRNYTTPGGSTGNEIVALPDPTNIRSRFARFDPRLSHLANMSAGIGGVAMLSQGDQENEEAAKRGILEYLGGL